MPVHMNTVACNEALVLHEAATQPNALFFGLNPGLVKSGIRSNLLGANSWTSSIVESLIGAFSHSADEYAASALPLLAAPELEARSGAMFGSKGTAILPSPGMTPSRAAELVAASRAAVDGVLRKKAAA